VSISAKLLKFHHLFTESRKNVAPRSVRDVSHQNYELSKVVV